MFSQITCHKYIRSDRQTDEKIYQQQPENGAAGGATADENGDVYGADFEDKT